MARLNPAAFLSYVRFDDAHEDGRLSEFRKRLSAEVRMQTGEDFPIFQDRNDISWGQNWQKRIDESIDHATFLICILTPGFFKSVACRKETERFIQREKELGREDLILAVYYVECLQLRDKKQIEKDKLAKLMSTRQYVDWRELRFEPFTSSEAGKSLAQIASQIRDSLERTSEKSKGKRAPRARRLKRPPTPRPNEPAIQKPDELPEIQRSLQAPAPQNEPVTRIVDSTGQGQHTSISEAIGVADPGNRILIRPGVYREHLTIKKPLELIGDGNIEDIVVTDENHSTVSFQTTIGRIVNLTIRQEQEFKSVEESMNALLISQGRLIIEHCQLFGRSGYVVAVTGGADPQITQNRIVNLGNTGGILVSRSRGLIEGNEITTKEAIGIVVLHSPAGPMIRKNVIRSGGIGVGLLEKSTSTIDDNDIAVGLFGVRVNEASDATVTRNRIHECFTGIIISSDSRAVIEGNAVVSNRENGIDAERGAIVKIAENIISGNAGYGVASAGATMTWGDNTLKENTRGDTNFGPPKPLSK
jgi:F-box protein 11